MQKVVTSVSVSSSIWMPWGDNSCHSGEGSRTGNFSRSSLEFLARSHKLLKLKWSPSYKTQSFGKGDTLDAPELYFNGFCEILSKGKVSVCTVNRVHGGLINPVSVISGVSSNWTTLLWKWPVTHHFPRMTTVSLDALIHRGTDHPLPALGQAFHRRGKWEEEMSLRERYGLVSFLSSSASLSYVWLKWRLLLHHFVGCAEWDSSVFSWRPCVKLRKTSGWPSPADDTGTCSAQRVAIFVTFVVVSTSSCPAQWQSYWSWLVLQSSVEA